MNFCAKPFTEFPKFGTKIRKGSFRTAKATVINMKLFAGYDGGGTKTACVLTDESGQILGFGLGGPSNYLYCGREVAAESVRSATEQAFADAGLSPRRSDTAYMASAAILIQHGDAHVPFFRTCIDADHLICESDICNIRFGAVRERPAVVTIAGTGAITYLCKKETLVRVGGWGPLLGDEGSGYDLGLRALKLACRMYDGREAEDKPFMDAIFGHYALSTPGELLRELNKGDIRSAVADAARVVFALYAQNSPTAAALLEACAEEIALAVQTAIRRDDGTEDYPLILSGGLLKNGSPLCDMLKARLLVPGSRISEITALQVHPAVASAALALHHAGLDDAVEDLLMKARGRML